jgi:sortase A
MIAVGVLGLVWALTIWTWQDPFTALYTHLQQNKLASSYEKRVEKFVAQPAAVPVGPTVADEKRAIAAAARRYRLTSREGDALGRIRIKRIGLNMILVNGTATGSLKKGPGRDLRTYLPGEGQLIYVAGHRTTYLAPFSHIDSIRPGDSVSIELPYATIVYRATGHVIVPADDLARLRSHGREVLALQACHPRFFATQRYIVYAKPVRVIPRAGKPYSIG